MRHPALLVPGCSANAEGPRLLFASAQEKAAKGGEDAHFVLTDGGDSGRKHSAAGVADGVGGWAQQGVDAGLYSRQLMHWSQHRLEHAEVPCVQDALAFSYRMTKVMGSSTACLILLHEGVLETLNVGDSGFLLARPGEEGGTENYNVVFKTTEQQHTFNMPYQLGTYSRDLPADGDFRTLEVRKGDIILVATDGVWDNVFEERILKIFEHAGGNLDAAAKEVAETSIRIGMSNEPTPFCARAQEVGLQHAGGKLDDVTVVLAHVV